MVVLKRVWSDMMFGGDDEVSPRVRDSCPTCSPNPIMDLFSRPDNIPDSVRGFFPMWFARELGPLSLPILLFHFHFPFLQNEILKKSSKDSLNRKINHNHIIVFLKKQKKKRRIYLFVIFLNILIFFPTICNIYFLLYSP